MLKFFIVVFLICFAYKFLDALSDLISIKKYYKLYNKYLTKQDTKIFECKTLCINLFKKLHIEDAKIPITQKTGYGHMASFTSSLFQNFPDNTTLFAPETRRMFFDAIGICKNNVKQCFSITYWINSILFLPQKILLYLNMSANSAFIKIFQVIYWLMAVIFTFAISVYNEEIKNFINSFIHFS